MTDFVPHSVIAAGTALVLLTACAPQAGVPGPTPGTASFKARVTAMDATATQSLGQLSRYLSQLNLAVVNLNQKRPPLMPLSKAAFATKQASDAAAEPQEVGADATFLSELPPTSGGDPVAKETVASDGTTSGTIDEDGDGDVDATYTQSKPVETSQPDGSKKVALTYTFDDDGEKDTFAVEETVDASGKVTGGTMDWTDETLGKQHVSFSPDEVRLEPVPGLLLVLKPSALNAKGHVQMAGDIVFDDRFASSKQPPGNGLPDQPPLSTQGHESSGFTTEQLKKWDYDGLEVGNSLSTPGTIAANMWCFDNEVDWRRNFHNWDAIGLSLRSAWCSFKNIERWWTYEHRKKNEHRLKLVGIENPALRLQAILESGNKAQDDSNLLVTMPDGSELRVKLPAKGLATGQTVDR